MSGRGATARATRASQRAAAREDPPPPPPPVTQEGARERERSPLRGSRDADAAVGAIESSVNALMAGYMTEIKNEIKLARVDNEKDPRGPKPTSNGGQTIAWLSMGEIKDAKTDADREREMKRFGRACGAYNTVDKEMGGLFQADPPMGVAVAERIFERSADGSLGESLLVDIGHDMVAKKVTQRELVDKAKAAAAGKAGSKGSGSSKGAAAGVAVGQQLLLQQQAAQQLLGQQQQQPQRQQRVAGPGDKCNFCHQFGHWARECIHNPRAEPRFMQQRQQREAQQGGLLALPAPAAQ